jgi:hypothetical protein
MYIHLVSLTKGAMRMVLVSQIDQAGEMRGLITTLNKQRANYVPVSAPIVYLKRQEFKSLALGEITPKLPDYKIYKSLLETSVEEGYAKLIGP